MLQDFRIKKDRISNLLSTANLIYTQVSEASNKIEKVSKFTAICMKILEIMITFWLLLPVFVLLRGNSKLKLFNILGIRWWDASFGESAYWYLPKL